MPPVDDKAFVSLETRVEALEKLMMTSFTCKNHTGVVKSIEGIEHGFTAMCTKFDRLMIAIVAGSMLCFLGLVVNVVFWTVTRKG